MNIAKALGDITKFAAKNAQWLELGLKLRDIFGGDKRKALAALRKWELDQRKARDKRMGR